MSEPQAWRPPDTLPLTLQTPRLLIRPYTSDDGEAIFEAIDTDRESYLPWLPWVRIDNRSVAECIFNIERFRRDALSWPCAEYVVGAFHGESGRLIGGIGFRPKSPALHIAEIGYWVRPDERGRGYCTEAVGHLISRMFTPQDSGGWELRRADVLMAAANEASQAVPRKLGMRLEFAAVQERWVEGVGYHDTRGYGILASEWDFERHCARADRQRGEFEPA